MRIPRCRATVSEETALGHWKKFREGRGRKRMVLFIILTREARRPARSVYFNLFRVQRRNVCAYLVFLFCCLCCLSSVCLSLAAFAADLKVKVVDPQGAAVARGAGVAAAL